MAVSPLVQAQPNLRAQQSTQQGAPTCTLRKSTVKSAKSLAQSTAGAILRVTHRVLKGSGKIALGLTATGAVGAGAIAHASTVSMGYFAGFLVAAPVMAVGGAAALVAARGYHWGAQAWRGMKNTLGQTPSKTSRIQAQQAFYARQRQVLGSVRGKINQYLKGLDENYEARSRFHDRLFRLAASPVYSGLKDLSQAFSFGTQAKGVGKQL